MCCVLLVRQAEGFQAVVRPPGTLSASARRAADGVQWTLNPRRPPLAMAAADAVKEELKVPMRIQLIVEPTPFTHVSGYANRFKEYLKYQKKAGAQVSIITPDDSPDAPNDFLGFPITTIRGFRFPLYKQIYLSWGISPVDGMRQGLLRRLSAATVGRVTTRRKNKKECLSIVSEVVDDFEPELVHVTSPGFIPYMTTYIAREWKDVPLMISYHTHIPVYARTYAPWLGSFGEWISWTVIRQLHNCADLTVVTSPQMKEEFEDHGVQRVEVWSKGIDTEVFHPKYGAKPWWTAQHAEDKDAELLEGAKAMRARLTAGSPESPLLIYVGRLGTEKRLRDVKAVLEKLPDAKLAIVGKGPDMEPLQAHFAGTSTVFTGLLSGVELSQAFAAADVFVMPSDSETLGFVVLESMASGVPVVGCNAGGIPSIIDQEETGFLFEAGDTEQLAGYVERLITDRPLAERMAAAARAEAERLGWEECTTKLREETYLQAVRNHRERQADVRTLRQKLKRYKEALFEGSRADVFAVFGDRKAEREAEKLEIEEWQLVEDIETLEKKPTTRQLLGWLSPRFDMPVRLGALLLFPWRLFTTQLRKLFGLIRSLFRGRGGDSDPPLAAETSP